MEFCNECGTKLERDIENSTDYAICSNCNKTVKKKINEKAIDEWEKLFGEYLFGKYGSYGYVNTPKNLSKKILD